jgi:hypothetical protein
MFGDWNWSNERTRLQQRRERLWFEKLADCRARVVVVEAGAGTSIPSVRHFSHKVSRDYGARIVRLNPRESQVPSSKDVGIAIGALEGLLGIDDAGVQY